MINNKKYMLAAIMFFFTSILLAQVNIEKYNNIIDSIGMNGNISFYASAKTGNTDIQEFGADGRLNFNGENFNSFLIAQGEYGWNKGKEYSNNALLHFRYLRELNQSINPEFFAQINYNKSRLLLFRSLVGLGFRLNLISDSLTNLTYGSAYMYEYENLDIVSSSVHPNKTYYHRWSNYISYSNSLTGNIRLSIVMYAQPRFDDFNDLRLLADNNLSIGLTDKLSLSLILRLRYDSEPPDKVKELDTNTKIGLSIKI